MCVCYDPKTRKKCTLCIGFFFKYFSIFNSLISFGAQRMEIHIMSNFVGMLYTIYRMAHIFNCILNGILNETNAVGNTEIQSNTNI